MILSFREMQIWSVNLSWNDTESGSIIITILDIFFDDLESIYISEWIVSDTTGIFWEFSMSNSTRDSRIIGKFSASRSVCHFWKICFKMVNTLSDSLIVSHNFPDISDIHIWVDQEWVPYFDLMAGYEFPSVASEHIESFSDESSDGVSNSKYSYIDRSVI